MKVTAVILNWNGEKYVYDCAASLAAQTFKDFETIVVDNASTEARHWSQVSRCRNVFLQTTNSTLMDNPR